jgi:hypothetical protein
MPDLSASPKGTKIVIRSGPDDIEKEVYFQGFWPRGEDAIIFANVRNVNPGDSRFVVGLNRVVRFVPAFNLELTCSDG